MNAPAFSDLPGYAGRLDASKLQRGLRHYNPAVCRVPRTLFGGRHGDLILCAYRVQGANGVSTVAIAQLSPEKLNVLADFALEFPGVGPRTHIEDPRLILVDNRLTLFVAEVDYGANYYFRMRAFRLRTNAEGISLGEEMPLPFGRNGQGVTEKNWMPFAIGGRGLGRELGLVHSIEREFTVIDTATGEVHKSPGVQRWRWGSVSGRTNAVTFGTDTALAFIGGHMPHANRRRLYWFGAAVFETVAPFRLKGISREPMVWGSELSPALLNPYDLHWNPVCVFPAGLVRENNDQVLLSVGVNDSFCEFLRLQMKDIADTMVDPAEITGDERLLAGDIPADALNGEQVRVRVLPKPNGRSRSIDELGGPFSTGEEFITTRSRAIALGNQVEIL